MSDDNLPVSADEPEQITRNNLGQWTAGLSGNPAGRPRGSRNRSSLVRDAITEAMLRDLSGDALKLLDTAKKMALKGDRQMLRLLLKDVIQRRDQDDDEDDTGPRRVTINVKNLTVAPTGAPADVAPGEGTPAKSVEPIDGEYTDTTPSEDSS